MESYLERFQKAMDLVHKKVNSEVIEKLPAGITPPQIMMLFRLYKLGLCKLSQLAECLEVKPSSITVMIDRLEKSGYVARQSDPNDRRIVLVQLTDKGHEVLKETGKLRDQALEPLVKDLTEAELVTLVETFEKITSKFTDQDKE